ncbi:hypothetical protein ARMSODRAFT_477471 [Armillaria solidipes]|uniref:Uncharacterized protein n=1 Tax=Armillaria solidipes TaxID=1076256 RepID=A0A2H3BB28_9AGAR|nr:hypothetical protein ARMSODRAFT_477471 [Armillaria solidipes]
MRSGNEDLQYFAKTYRWPGYQHRNHKRNRERIASQKSIDESRRRINTSVRVQPKSAGQGDTTWSTVTTSSYNLRCAGSVSSMRGSIIWLGLDIAARYKKGKGVVTRRLAVYGGGEPRAS